MQFQQDWPKDKKWQLFYFFGWKLRKISLDWALWCVFRGIDNFSKSQVQMLYVNGKLSISWVEIASFSKTGRNTKKSPLSKLFLWTVFKHGLQEGSTILLQYSATNRTPLESSSLGELKYAISPGYDVRPKNKSIRKGKKWHCATGVQGHCIADWFRQALTSLDKSEHVWSAIFPQRWVARCPNLAQPPNLHAVF